jgi:hypothetical protein
MLSHVDARVTMLDGRRRIDCAVCTENTVMTLKLTWQSTFLIGARIMAAPLVVRQRNADFGNVCEA